jgi:peroxiredoxin
LPEIAALGGRIIAISPQLPDGSLATADANKLEFDVLSDVARTFRPQNRRAGPAMLLIRCLR